MRTVATLLVALAFQIQPAQPPRDRPQPREVTGTGIIRGHVVAADTGQPIRKAMVTLSYTPPTPPSASGSGPVSATATVTMVGGGTSVVSIQPGAMMRPRQAQTDQNGAFEFTQLAPGSYRVMVSSPQYSGQYLGIAYGATKPLGPGSIDPGKTIELSNGESFDKVNVALPRGGVITGRVTDESGFPMARVGVYGILYPAGSSRGVRTGGGTQTDDLGQFRVYGLQPGDYAVVAEARNNTFVPPGTPASENDDDRTGYLTTFYPSSSDEAMAQRVRVNAARETGGIDIRVVSGRMYRISGMVIDSQGQPLSGAMGQLIHSMPATAGSFGAGFSTDAQGKFQLQNIAGGDYRIVIRQRMPGPPVAGQPPEVGEMAMVPLTLNGTDAENLLIATSPGISITGHVTYDPAPPDSTAGRPSLRVMATFRDPSTNMGMPSPQPATVQSDGSFTMKGLLGEYVLRVIGLQPSSYLKSITAGADDIIDTPRVFKQGDDVSVVISTRGATLEGTVADDKGQPAENAGIVLFADDKASWQLSSIWTRRSSTTSKGTFRISGLRPGRYYLVAVPRERLANIFGPPDPKTEFALFEGLAKDATSLVINEDEQRTVDLRLAGAGGG